VKRDHDAGKTSQRDRDLRRNAKSFTRLHGRISSTRRSRLWKHFLLPVD